MPQISTGLGLAMLGGCILGAAALSSPQFVRSASADGQHTEAQSRVRTSQGPCDSLPERWFSSTPHLLDEPLPYVCEGLFYGLPARGPVNLLGDGRQLNVSAPDYICFGDTYSQWAGSISIVEFFREADGSSGKRLRSIISSDDQDLHASISALIGRQDFCMRWDSGGGFADMDGDGDLDFVFIVWGATGQQFAWLENIAGGTKQPNPYDFDDNGSVDTADLAMFLLNFPT